RARLRSPLPGPLVRPFAQLAVADVPVEQPRLDLAAPAGAGRDGAHLAQHSGAVVDQHRDRTQREVGQVHGADRLDADAGAFAADAAQLGVLRQTAQQGVEVEVTEVEHL